MSNPDPIDPIEEDDDWEPVPGQGACEPIGQLFIDAKKPGWRTILDLITPEVREDLLANPPREGDPHD